MVGFEVASASWLSFFTGVLRMSILLGATSSRVRVSSLKVRADYTSSTWETV